MPTRIEKIIKSCESPYFHAGEICDSLAFDHLTGFSLKIPELFSKHQNGTIVFRTKSTNIDNLLSIPAPPVNVKPYWTLSPLKITDSIDHKTPSFEARLEAARMCQEAGYEIGVRPDPVILVEGWEKEYYKMVSRILTVLDTERIDYISLGTLSTISSSSKRYSGRYSLREMENSSISNTRESMSTGK